MMDLMSAREDTPSIAPTLLVSMPQMLDPNFAKTVVLLCEHGRQGAFGLVLRTGDGGKTWALAALQAPVLPRWTWPGWPTRSQYWLKQTQRSIAPSPAGAIG